jgi:hypothetical protein
MGDVVIWHIGRCGSTVLGSTLNQHPAVQWENEIFRPYVLEKRAGKHIPAMDEVIATVKAHKIKAVQAVEVKFLKCQHPGIFGATLEETVAVFLAQGFDRFVVLHRTNYLRRIISHCVVQETEQYFVQNPKDSRLHAITMDVNAIKVGAETRSLLEWFEVFAEGYRHLGNLLKGHSCCLVTYEDNIQNDPRIGYAKVCRFLGLEPVSVDVLFIRTNPFQLGEILRNYEEVVALLATTPYRWMVER